MIQDNVAVLNRELSWFQQLSDLRMKRYFAGDEAGEGQEEPQPPDLSGDPAVYARSCCIIR